MPGLMILPKFESEHEALGVSQAVGFQGAALMAYLARTREAAMKALMNARVPDDVVRMQGAAQMLDDLIEKLKTSRQAADRMEKKQ